MSIREEVTHRIVLAMLEGPPPWRKGWTPSGLNANAVTGKPYRGVNQLLLGMQGHADPRWMTYRQAKEAGYQVRKGAKSTKIVRMVEVDKRDDNSNAESEVIAEEKGWRLVMRFYDVFNAEQIDGLPPLPSKSHAIEPSDAADAIVDGLKATGLKLIHGGPAARYSMHVDAIHMPQKADFHSTEDYYSTLLHEAAHSTAAPHRLKREFGMPNSPTRAKEELIAEISSAMLCAEVGIPMGQSQIQSHAAYVLSWVSVLKNDVNAIFEAAGAAQGICDYLNAHKLSIEPHSESILASPALTPSVAAPTLRM